jgi:hypothetical protein
MSDKYLHYITYSRLNYKALSKGNGIKRVIRPKDRFQKYSEDNYECVFCKSNEINDLRIDHIIPVAKMGINHIDNYMTLCKKCNLLKSDKGLEYLLTKKKELMNRNLVDLVVNHPIFEGSVRQCQETEMVSANDLCSAGNKWRVLNSKTIITLQTWLNTSTTQEFINELKINYGEVIKTRRGSNGGTWLHPYLAIDLALYVNPVIKIEAYEWLYKHLIEKNKYNETSYKKMCGAIWDRTSRKTSFAKDIAKLAVYIQKQCGVEDWQTATEEQLRLRDRIHENIALLVEVMNNINEAIRLGVEKALKQ